MNRYSYAVIAEYDGCSDEKPLYQGGQEQCLAYITRHWHRYTGKHSLGLRNNSTGRQESFVLNGLKESSNG